ncbi:MAG: hydantoinase/oxoprolinase family protein [Rhodospirillaceae bacterium]|nr:hydantoinase/oxoprolinase family protein [Rhodospirillaceae bacterium]
MSQPSCRLSIDVGGTFTDVVLLDEATGAVRFAKVSSTPADPSTGSLNAAETILASHGATPESVSDLIHATTVATNAVLEGAGACTGLITTRGFRDTLEMRREGRYDIYDLNIQMPPPLVPRSRRMEIDERITFDGVVLTPLDEDQILSVITILVEEHKIDALAICLLHGYAHPEHEARVAEITARHFPELTISVSHDVAGEIREFERISTTVVDAYVKPLAQRYITRLADGLRALDMPRDPAIMLSHGGVGPAKEVVQRFPVRMIESGPAAGAIAAAYFARTALSQPNALAFDMGGTTAKISVIQNGEPSVANEYEVGHAHRFKSGSGYPLQISAIELLEIGAGGGSIAYVNDLGLLKVGPRSAGADPGPACYGRGGELPTVTDADLVLGYLDAGYFLGGDMTLDVDLARKAIQDHLAVPLNMSIEQAAHGVHEVVNEHMAAATRAHAAEKGIDLRQFAMIAFGGAGPVHAAGMAPKLGLRQVLYPFGAGVASAIGCLTAPAAVDLVAAYFSPLDGVDWSVVEGECSRMKASGERILSSITAPGTNVMRLSVDMRCKGQGYSVTVSIPEGETLGGPLANILRDAFTSAYGAVHGHQPPNVPLEIVALRARVEHPKRDDEVTLKSAPTGPGTALKGSRKMYFNADQGYADTPVYDRYKLSSGARFEGPAIIEERETSILIGPDTGFWVDENANLIAELSKAAER